MKQEIVIRLDRGMVRRALVIGVVFGVSAVPTWIIAGQVGSLTSFNAGDPIVAADMNTNFTNVRTAVNDNDGRIAALEAAVAAIQGNSVLAGDGVLTFDTHNSYARALFTGVNVQVVNGDAQTSPNGRGNLIVGYNDIGQGPLRCSDGTYDNQTDCESALETWSNNHKTGSHNIVGGNGNNYSRTGGLIVGNFNTINRDLNSVTGGLFNLASGDRATVSGGTSNVASGNFSSATGGAGSIASGDGSSVLGGGSNIASADYSAVLGGGSNEASGIRSCVSGGMLNTASGFGSSVSGGNQNEAIGEVTNVTGGYNNDASGNVATVCGGRTNNAVGSHSTVLGGWSNSANVDDSTNVGDLTKIYSDNMIIH